MNKYLFTPVKQRFLTLWVDQTQLEEWMDKWRFFFMLAMGRSGTAFMANLLNQAPGAHVFHEPVLEDFSAYVRAFYSPQDAEGYVQGFRIREIYLRTKRLAPGIYGEVDGILRRHAEALRKAFPKATLVHLVRDGRDVVRSMISRTTMSIMHPVSVGLHPVEPDPWRSRWHEMDRFSRSCWLWRVENSFLRSKIGRTVQFEKVLSNYDYFCREILEPLHLSIGREGWEMAVSHPRNMTSSYKMSKWHDWTPEQQRAFSEICGDEMVNCGYVL